ncbi:MAG: deoxyribodipyrimidine photo-lyase, partial [Candidatus Limnocylindrus sp.]
MSAPVTILWLRRDLRLADHPALIAAAAHAHEKNGTLLPIFIWEPGVFAGRRASANRTWYLRESLRELSRELEKRGSTLLELEGPGTSALPALVEQLTTSGTAASEIALFFTRDHTPYARARDRAVAELLAPRGVTVHATRGLTVVEPDELLTGGGTAYGVYTPYFRRWLERVSSNNERPLKAPGKLPAPPSLKLTAALRPDHSAIERAAQPTATVAHLPVPGESAARAAAERWLTAARGSGANGYAARRNT